MASSSATYSQAAVRMGIVGAGPRFGNSAGGHGPDVNKPLCVGSCGVVWTSRPMARDPRGVGDASRKLAGPELSTGNTTIQGQNKDKTDLLCHRTPPTSEDGTGSSSTNKENYYAVISVCLLYPVLSVLEMV